ncbi:MAG: transcriptional repressor [Candidatus Marinimicrobia bacterium]|nr:transcriptional repressor [Candidatus Neomarinimicrobiota bacterium]
MNEQKRNTKQKKAIYDVLTATTSHPTAEWVFQEVQKDIPKISLATVYRNLSSMVKEGTVNVVLTEKNIFRYDADTHAHAHFVCSNCNEISDFHDCKLSVDHLTKKGYRVHAVNVQYIGICNICQNQGA